VGRQTLPSPRQFKQRCSRVVPHAGHELCTGVPPSAPPPPPPPADLLRRSCRSDTGARQRMMALPAHCTWATHLRRNLGDPVYRNSHGWLDHQHGPTTRCSSNTHPCTLGSP
jgi:hypothetical protein